MTKCTPMQITLNQISLKLHKLINEMEHGLKFEFEHVTIINEIVCTRRQTTFEIFKNNRSKIGMNTTINVTDWLDRTNACLKSVLRLMWLRIRSGILRSKDWTLPILVLLQRNWTWELKEFINVHSKNLWKFNFWRMAKHKHWIVMDFVLWLLNNMLKTNHS